MSTITSANSVVALTVPGLFPAPVLLHGFSAERIWESDSLVMTESQIGVDGRKTAGYIFNLLKQTFSLQADSPSRNFFTTIINAQKAAREIFIINGTIDLPATNESFICSNGTLESAKMLPDGGKVLQAMDFVIVWQSIQPTLS